MSKKTINPHSITSIGVEKFTEILGNLGIDSASGIGEILSAWYGN